MKLGGRSEELPCIICQYGVQVQWTQHRVPLQLLVHYIGTLG